MDTKELFQELQKKGYKVHNKRVLGNPTYTSEETKKTDLVQEYALVVQWLWDDCLLWVHTSLSDKNYDPFYPNVLCVRNRKTMYSGGQYGFVHPLEAIVDAIIYTVKNLI